MAFFYPQAALRHNPEFSVQDCLTFAQDVEAHASCLYEMAFAAFARATDRSQGDSAARTNVDLLVAFGQALIRLYHLAREDDRIDSDKVGEQVNRLFWAIIGATEVLLGTKTGDDWLKDWHYGLDRGGLLARLCADLALARAAKGWEQKEMTSCLSRLAAFASQVRSYHFQMLDEVPEDAEELIGLAGDAGRIAQTLEDGAAQLGALGHSVGLQCREA